MNVARMRKTVARPPVRPDAREQLRSLVHYMQQGPWESGSTRTFGWQPTGYIDGHWDDPDDGLAGVPVA